MESAANNSMEESLFMQWAMDTLLPEEEPAAVDDGEVFFSSLQALRDASFDDGCGEVVAFPSLQALRDASHAAEMVRELMAGAETHDATNSLSSGGSGDGGEVADGGSSGTTDPAALAATDYYGGSWPSPQSPNSSFARAPPPPPPPSGHNTNITLPTVSWNFVTGSAQPGRDGVLEEAAVPARSLPPPELTQRRRSPPPPRRTHPIRIRSMGAPSSVSCTPDHIVAERKRREKINKRLIELSTVIPDLKKMDKATILTDAAKYVKELQQRLKALEEASTVGAAAGSIKSKGPPLTDENNGGSRSPTSASSSSGTPALPEIEARFWERSVMVRINCVNGKGVAAAAFAVVEGLGLTVVHANVMPFSACTIIITITAEMEGRRLTLTTEQIISKLKSALSHQGSFNCKDTEETQN